MKYREVELGVGVDCEDLDRWRRLLPAIRAGRFGRAFSPEEHEHCRRAGDAAEAYAGRWCAKEAVVKAVSGMLRICIRDVRIEVASDGAPIVHICPPSAEVAVRVSIAHSGTQAVAFAVATRLAC